MSQPVTFSQARQGFKFFSQTASRAQLTIDWYEERLAQFEAFLLSKCAEQPPLLAGIEPNCIREFIVTLQNRDVLHENHAYREPIARKLSPFTIHGYLRTLAAFFRWAKREGLVERNPMENIPRPKLPKSVKPRFEKPDLESLVKACSTYPKPHRIPPHIDKKCGIPYNMIRTVRFSHIVLLTSFEKCNEAYALRHAVAWRPRSDQTISRTYRPPQYGRSPDG